MLFGTQVVNCHLVQHSIFRFIIDIIILQMSFHFFVICLHREFCVLIEFRNKNIRNMRELRVKLTCFVL